MASRAANVQRAVQWAGLAAGPVLALLTYRLLPETYTPGPGESPVVLTAAGRATLAMMVWMAVWWLTEAIDISATALLPIAVFPLVGVATIGAATAPYASHIIYLFLGGFLLALSMQRWGLDRRIALITLRIVGTRPVNMIAGFMIATAVMSAFVSNTATTAMMLPIGLSVIDLVLRKQTGSALTETGVLPATTGCRNFALCLMLGIAYAASIGGISTIIGTPPNGILIQFMDSQIAEPYRTEISFAKWMVIGVPLAAVFLPLSWLLLTRVLYPVRIGRIEGGRELIEQEYRALGPANRGEWITFIVFICTTGLWIFRPLIEDLSIAGSTPFRGLSDSGIAIAAGLVLFVIPVDFHGRDFTMNWDTAKRLPWGILILFGGGLSLADAVQANGVAEFLGAQAGAFAGAPTVLIVLLVTAAVIFLTELTSNTATAATLVPILAGLAPGMGIHPYVLIIPAAIAASCAFMMPVATPPNAIVFGSGYVTIPQMCKAGLWLNLLGVLLVTALLYAVIIPLLAIS